MSGTRLDAPGNSRDDVRRGHLGARLDGVFARLASLTAVDGVAPGLLERRFGSDPIFGPRYLPALQRWAAEAGRPEPTSLAEAAGILGPEALRRVGTWLAVAAVAKDLAPRAGLRPDAQFAWSVATGFAAARLDRSALAETAGALVNVGVLALAHQYGANYGAILDALTGEATPLHQAERMAFGTDHGTEGQAVLKVGGFSDDVTSAVAGHCAAGPNEGLAGSLRLAEALVHQLGFDGGVGLAPPDLSMEALAAKGVDESSLGAFAQDLTQTVQMAQRLLA